MIFWSEKYKKNIRGSTRYYDRGKVVKTNITRVYQKIFTLILHKETMVKTVLK